MKFLLPQHSILFYFFVLTFFANANQVNAQENTKKIQFQSSSMEVDEKLGNGAKRLLGNVVFTHGGAKMYCDSAYFYSEINTLDAFDNVYINQGDTLDLYGDFLHYDGNTKIANVRRNVKLYNRKTKLKTEALDYNLGTGVGYYTNYAFIDNEETTLESIIGYYYTRSDMLHFRDSVIITHPDYTILSDTIQYHTKTKIAFFFGPTEILSDSNYIYCERGWYNTTTDISQLNQNALVRNDKNELHGDSIYYERETGFGRAVNNVELFDFEQDVILRGHWGEYYENTEFAVITDSALFIQITSEDSVYVHADTLRSMPDTSGEKLIQAYYNVKIFKTNIQGKCDSLAYSFVDSTSRLFYEPVLWSQNQQVSAEYIEILNKGKQIDKMYLNRSSFIVMEQDTTMYNQIKGKNMICHFKNNDLYKIDVIGNGQTVYYPKDEEEIIGANKAICSNLVIHFNEEGDIHTITFLTNPDATLYPLEKAPKNELILKGFTWLDDLRPKRKEDIFIK